MNISNLSEKQCQLTQSELTLQHVEADEANVSEPYLEHAEMREKAGSLRVEILKGIAAGHDIYTLFLKAAKAISLMTGDSAFYSQCEADILAIYGEGLLKPAPLKAEMQAILDRIARMSEALQTVTDPETQRRIKWAIDRHNKRLKELNTLLGNA